MPDVKKFLLPLFSNSNQLKQRKILPLLVLNLMQFNQPQMTSFNHLRAQGIANVIFLFTFFFSTQTFAQFDTVKDIEPNHFVVGLRSEIAGKANLQQWCEDSRLTCKRLFPNHTSPTHLTNESGFPLADLSLIYEITTPTTSPEAAIRLCKKVKGIAWAEPFYRHQLLYNPNDPFAAPGSAGQSNYLSLVKA